MRNHILGAALFLSALSGCVSQGKYDSAVAEAERLRGEQRAMDAAAANTAAKRAALCRDQIATLRRNVALLESEKAQLEIQVAMTADTSADRKRQLGETITESKKRLEELRRAQAAAEARAALFRGLAQKLKKMLDAGEVEIKLRDGRMVLVMPTDVLFDSGKTKIKPAGRRALEQVSSALATVQGRHFQVAGHTDNEPIKVSGYLSNWELSTARALEIVHLFTERGLRPEALSAAGYGEFDPVSSNKTSEGRTKNRRIEITLQPNIDELVAVP